MLGKLVSDSCIYEACMNPTLNEISVVRHFERGDVIEMGDFDFLHGTVTCISFYGHFLPLPKSFKQIYSTKSCQGWN